MHTITLTLSKVLIVLALVLIGKALYMPAKAIAAQILLEAAWQRTIMSGQETKPWPWADTTTLARVAFPDHDESFILLAGSMGRTLAFGPGHLSGSRLPHQDGHMVISAHRDTHFAFLENMAVGDRIEVVDRDSLMKSYRVNGLRVIDSRFEQLELSHDSDRLTLITCYPFTSIEAGGPLRLRVEAILDKSYKISKQLSLF